MAWRFVAEPIEVEAASTGMTKTPAPPVAFAWRAQLDAARMFTSLPNDWRIPPVARDVEANAVVGSRSTTAASAEAEPPQVEGGETAIDPLGILNPGKILPDDPAGTATASVQ